MSVYNEVHDLVYHGGGGYSYSEVYNMPIWVRRFTFQKLKEAYEQRAEAISKKQQTLTNDKPSVLRPGITSNYSTKTSPK